VAKRTYENAGKITSWLRGVRLNTSNYAQGREMAWIGISYLVVCYAALAFLLRVWAGNSERWASLRRALAAISVWRKTLVVAVFTLVFLLFGPLLPLVVAHCIWSGRRESQFWKRFAKQHRDVVMEPIAFNQMQPAGRELVMKHERAIEAVGFQSHNTYLYKPEPLLIEARYYLSEDGRTILSMGHIGGEEFYSLTSFLSGGSGIETGVSHHPIDADDINATSYYYTQMFDVESGTDVAAMYIEHQAYLDRLSRETGEKIVVIRRDQLVPAVRYANRRFAAAKHLLGELDAAPPETEWPFSDEIGEAVEI
jgi:hypothetical protein